MSCFDNFDIFHKIWGKTNAIYGVTLKAAFSEVRRDWLENLITELNGLLGRLQNREVERPEPVVNSGGKEDLEIYGKNILYSDKRRKIISDVYIVDPNMAA